jgi:hypothetical protein
LIDSNNSKSPQIRDDKNTIIVNKSPKTIGNLDKNKIKVNNKFSSIKSNSPVAQKLSTPSNTSTVSNNAKNTPLNNAKKPSLLKQYEELKNRNVSPMIKNQEKKEVSPVRDIKPPPRFGARGTIQVNQPEYLFRDLNSKKEIDEKIENQKPEKEKIENQKPEKERENKLKDFRENNTSPILIRVNYFLIS